MREIQFIKESNTRKPRDFFRVNAFFLWKNLFFRLKESHRWDFTCRSSLRLSVPTGGYLNHRAVGKEMLLFWRQSAITLYAFLLWKNVIVDSSVSVLHWRSGIGCFWKERRFPVRWTMASSLLDAGGGKIFVGFFYHARECINLILLR